ncbi:MAG: ABC transporter ATP-binding protein [Candidatus Omnitrophota bacterium]|nr:ABC transporter ATP-binding protein/permease [Candidatus Omnitrophota bacterium]MBU1894201.1 ABC transporter ATP-binding protein/permease [Candidatus Omnitrophota bacterium]
MKRYIRFIKLILPHSRVFIMAVVCMILTTLFSASPLGLIIPLVDKVITGKQIIIPANVYAPQVLTNIVVTINEMSPLKLLNALTILLVIMFSLKGIFEFFQNYLMTDVSQRVIRDVKNSTYKKLQELSMDFYSRNPTGQLMSRITYDADVIRDAISSGLADTFYQPIQIICYTAILAGAIYLGVSWNLIFVSLILFPMILYPVVKIGKRLRKISKSSQEKVGDINNMLLETIAGIKLVKSFCMQDYEWKRFKEHNHSFYRLNMKSVKRMKIVSPMTECMGIACVAVILWMAGKDIVSGMLSVGVFSTFIAAIFSMMKPVKKLSNVYGINQQALAAAERIFNLWDEPVTIQEKEKPILFESFKDNIVFENVSFAYNKEKENVLNGINLTIEKGKIIALVGPSGGGKSTLVNLIPRFYDPDSGEIKLDGKNLKDLEIKSLREKIGFVTQETLLFNDTVRANISYGHEEIDEDQLVRVAKAANAHMFIKDFPEGYNTVIGERGLKISGGQRQRIAIARAVYKNPPILIFDEATSQLDTESEKLVQDAINNLMQGRTVVVIAHRLSTIKHSDKIVVIDKGRLAASGTHKELLSKNALYKRLYEMQFADQEK